ncbi:MAG: hypothetical protein ACKPBG_02865, partial [Actinomycetota bacterium]
MVPPPLTRVRSSNVSAPGPIVAVLLAATLFGTTGTALALGPEDAGAVSAGIMRLLIGGLGLVLLALMTGSHLDPSPRTRRALALGAVTV